jgi:hypothetical protein
MGRQKILITEEQLQRYLQEQGLYGDNSDVVDYDLPEYLSDVIILSKLGSFNDVEKSVKELYKRLIRVEKGLDDAGSHNKAYSTDTKYASHNKKFNDFEKKDDSIERDEELKKEISRIEQMIDLQKAKREEK